MVLPTMVLEWNNAHLLPPFKKDRVCFTALWALAFASVS
jgi:hypothetical protein